MSSTEGSRYGELVDRFFTGYNDMDEDALRALLAEDITWGHRNKFSGEGREELIASFRQIGDAMQSRNFGPVIRWAENGNTFYCEHQWFAVPAIDDPAWGWKKGEPFSMYAASIITFDGDKIVDWVDFG